MKLKRIYILFILVLVHTHGRAQLLDLLTISSDSSCISDRSDQLLVRGFVEFAFLEYVQVGLV